VESGARSSGVSILAPRADTFAQSSSLQKCHHVESFEVYHSEARCCARCVAVCPAAETRSTIPQWDFPGSPPSEHLRNAWQINQTYMLAVSNFAQVRHDLISSLRFIVRLCSADRPWSQSLQSWVSQSLLVPRMTMETLAESQRSVCGSQISLTRRTRAHPGMFSQRDRRLVNKPAVI
jgi:hypothetical protein